MKKIFIIILAVSLSFTFLSLSYNYLYADNAERTGELKNGAFISLGFYEEKPIIWQVIKNDEIGTMLISTEILSYKAFDAKGDKADGRDNKYNSRVAEGSNYWPKSNIREWLNSDEQLVTFSHQKPDKEHIYKSSRDLSYDKEPGFLTNFSFEEKSYIIPIKHKVALSEFDLSIKDGGSYVWKWDLGEEDAYFQWITDRVFLLSYDEFHNLLKPLGSIIEIKPQFTFEDGATNDEYWLRNPSPTAYSSTVYTNEGDMANAYTPRGVRPALYIKGDLSLIGKGTKESPYMINKNLAETGDTKELQFSPWAAADIEKAISYGLITDKVMKDMQSPINREEFAELAMKVFYALSDWEIAAPKVSAFDDTNNPEILKAAELLIVSGVAPRQYAPAQLITREQIATMFQRTMYAVRPKLQNAVADDTPPVFADKNQIAAWAVEGVNFVSSRGLITGVGNNRFAPKEYASKEQAIVLIKRIYEYLKNIE